MKILNTLTLKHLKMNKKRTIVTIIGVILSTALMVGIGLLFASLRDNNIKVTEDSRGSYHAVIKEVPSSKKMLLENNAYIKNVYYRHDIGYAEMDMKNRENHYLFVTSATKGILNQLHLDEGRLPENENEIVLTRSFLMNEDKNFKVGDTLTLPLGMRKMPDGSETLKTEEYVEGESLSIKEEKTYKIVGILNKNFLESYSLPGYMAITKYDITQTDSSMAYITYKNPKDAYEKTKKIAQNIGFGKEEIKENTSYNDALLSSYGVSRYSNIIDAMLGIVMIVLTLISIGCTIVIYNSFAISVMERKKQFGLFSSIGATKAQIKHTVFFEAMIVGMIGIPLGILGAFIGIYTVLEITNHLLHDVFTFPLALSIYPTFIIVPVCFMILVIIISAFLPAFKASKVTPIEAIRQNDDIKIKGKKIRTPFIIKKIFGAEGELALKNMKRNKKKYRITIISLFISIVLFISFGSLLNYGVSSTNDIFQNPSFDLMINIIDNDENKINDFYHNLEKREDVNKISLFQTQYIKIDNLESNYSKKAKEMRTKDNHSMKNPADFGILIRMDQKNYKNLLKKIDEKEEVPILLNNIQMTEYSNSARKVIKFPLLKKKAEIINIYKENLIEDEEKTYLEKIYTLNKIKYIDELPFGHELFAQSTDPNIIVNKDEFSQIYKNLDSNHKVSTSIIMKVKKTKEIEQYLSKIEKNHTFHYYNYQNIKEMVKLEKNLIFVIELLLYGFIALVTLIGVTSVFNTINTSIALRRKEFAMLRSIGLTPHGFNKILYLESIFVGIKSLLYAIPVSLFVTYLIEKQVTNVITTSFIIPYKSILLSIIGVFIIVLFTMMYASSKIKKENILEAIREENI